MPLPLIQDSTTLSSRLTLVTALPVSSTTPVPSWPRQCGTHLSSPLSPRHSITCVPQAPEYVISTNAWPGLSAGISIRATTNGVPVWTRRAASVFISLVSMQRVNDFVGDLVGAQSKHLAGVFLLAGFLEEGVGRPEAHEIPVRGPGIGQPFRHGGAEPADQRILLDGSHQLETLERALEEGFVERLHGMEAHDLR